MVKWSWVRNYDDVPPCIELIALYGDALKKDETFTKYAIILGQQIADCNKLGCKVTWGKWGARLETTKNKKFSEYELERFADIIISNANWKALQESTRIFTYGLEEKSENSKHE